MKASIEWLKEYSDIDISASELGDILTMTGTKVETIDEQGKDIKNVVVGKILSIEKHPDADKLVVTKVDIGSQVLQIVTGAKNIHVGDIIPIAKDGAKLPGGKEIHTGSLRGIDSCGMMCSIGELGLDHASYPEQIEDGIMILSKDEEKNLGKNIVEVLELEDSVIDFEITPNRVDCFAIEGIGREVAVSLNKPFKDPHKHLLDEKVETKDSLEGIKVKIEDPDLCYRYMARVVKNVKIGPSPKWLTKRLNSAGVRAINNIVDITNYVMLELGQPMHAFDINTIEGNQINVRRAKKGEKIITLDKQERNLDETMLVIADSKKPMAIAGVMGGLDSDIKDNTSTIVFESACFYGGNVRKTAKKVGLRTESSSRFEKGLSSENSKRALARAIELVQELGIGDVVEGEIDVYPTKQKQPKVELNVEKINDLLGILVSKEDMIETFKKLQMDVVEENGKTYIIPPYFRLDIEQRADLAEEVLRFYGYDTLQSTLIHADSTIGLRNKKQNMEENIRGYLVNHGLSEIYTYAFTNEKELEKLNLDEQTNLYKQAIRVENPLSEDYTLMRPTTLGSMLQTISTNINYKNEDVKLFDLSRVYRSENDNLEKGELPKEEVILTIGMYGKDEDFYTLKGIIENILEVSHISHYDVAKQTENKMYHPGRCANINIGKDTIATFGEVHPSILHNYDISKRIYVAEINIDKMVTYSREKVSYTPIPKFPAVERDIAIVVDEEIEVGKIQKSIEKKAKKLLESVNLFDVYRDEKLGENKKSVAYSLKFRIPTRTLTDEEVNKTMEDIIQELEQTYKAELRK